MYFGQDLDAMYESRCAREWEELNQTPIMDEKEVEYDLDEAMDSIKDACRALGLAEKEADGFPIASRIRSLFGDLETIQDDLTSLIARLKEVKSA